MWDFDKGYLALFVLLCVFLVPAFLYKSRKEITEEIREQRWERYQERLAEAKRQAESKQRGRRKHNVDLW